MHFDYSSLFTDAQIKKVARSEKSENCEEPLDENQTECHEIERSPSKEGDNPSF
jgi:hypothetical protein